MPMVMGTQGFKVGDFIRHEGTPFGIPLKPGEYGYLEWESYHGGSLRFGQ